MTRAWKFFSMSKIIAISLFFFANVTNASLVTFNGTTSSVTSVENSYTENSFIMTNVNGTNYFIDNSFSNLFLNNWDDDVLEFNSATSKVIFTSASNSLFNFTNASLGSLNSAAEIQIEGMLSAGGSIVQIFNLALNTKEDIIFSGFNNLTSLTISSLTDGQYAIIDDLAFTPSSVPVPSAVWLLGSGLIGLIGMKKNPSKLSGKYA